MNKHPQLLSLTAALAVLLGSFTCTARPRNCPMSVVTYNAALTPLVYGYEQRRSEVPEALRNQTGQADFVCLQEVWFEDDMRKILDSVEELFPFHYSPIHEAVGELREKQTGFWAFLENWKNIPCSVSQLIKLNLCFGWNCLHAVDQQQCMVESCSTKLYQLSDTCRSCISMASIDTSTLWSKCANMKKTYNRMNSPGLVVLSKRNLTSVTYDTYHTGALVERGYIKAQVEDGHTFVCTHLTAVFPHYYDVNLDMFDNYTNMQRAEIVMLNDAFSETVHILLGDLNTGPKTKTLAGEVEENYEVLTKDMGYLNPYLRMNGKCTYCHDNAVLVAENKTHYGDQAIDHVLLSTSFPGDFNDAKRVLDQPMLSDHYGVQMDLDPCNSP